MASSPELVQYIADQLSPCGTITFKKMFGEYGLYLNGKMFASVCDDTLFVKPTKAGRALVPDCLLAPPYPGAKDCLLIENVDNRDLLWPQQPVMNCPRPNRRKRFQNDGTFPFFRSSKGCTK